jgi:hypothetical protein
VFQASSFCALLYTHSSECTYPHAVLPPDKNSGPLCPKNSATTKRCFSLRRSEELCTQAWRYPLGELYLKPFHSRFETYPSPQFALRPFPPRSSVFATLAYRQILSVPRLRLHGTHSLPLFSSGAEALWYVLSLTFLPIDTHILVANATTLPHQVWHKADLASIEEAVDRACDDMSSGSLALLASALQVNRPNLLRYVTF